MESHLGEDTDRWRSAPPESVAWVSWGNDRIAYHRPSGGTHFLNLASKKLVTEILRQPSDLNGVLAAFGVSETDPDWVMQQNEMRSLLLQLEHLGFIERL